MGGGVVWGFREGLCDVKFRALTAWGRKAVEQSGGAGSDTPSTVYLRVGAGRDCGRGWVGSSTILFALLEHRVRKMSRMEGGEGHQWFLQRLFTVRWRVLRSAAQQVSVPDSDAAGQHALNGTPVEGGEDGWREACLLFSRRRKCRRCSAFLEIDLVLVVQVRSSVMCNPQEVSAADSLTVEVSMVSGGWSTEFLLKSITTSFVFSTLRDRLLAPHHSASCATSSL